MKKVKTTTKLLALFLFLGVFFIIPTKVFASSNPFEVNYNILYTITKAGTARVQYHINITNLTQSEYASSYTLSLTNTDASNITVTDSSGASLPFTNSSNSSSTSIVTNFPQASYGYGSGENWSLYW